MSKSAYIAGFKLLNPPLRSQLYNPTLLLKTHSNTQSNIPLLHHHIPALLSPRSSLPALTPVPRPILQVRQYTLPLCIGDDAERHAECAAGVDDDVPGVPGGESLCWVLVNGIFGLGVLRVWEVGSGGG